MKRTVFAVCLMLVASLSPVRAEQELTALARVEPELSVIEDRWFGATRMTIGLSQGVPFRVFLLNDPPRLVVDFRQG